MLLHQYDGPPPESPDTSQILVRELELATLLVDSLAAAFEPSKYRDRYRENLRAGLDAKIRGEEVGSKGAIFDRAELGMNDFLRRNTHIPCGSRRTASDIASCREAWGEGVARETARFGRPPPPRQAAGG